MAGLKRSLAISLAGAIALLACQPVSPKSPAPVQARPLPKVVKGANLRPVGDRRRGYGTRTARQTMQRLRRMGVNTLALLMEGRMSQVDATVVRVQPREDLEATRQALLDAQALGFATVLVPHIYIDDGTWRGTIKFEDPAKAQAWWRSYQAFVLQAASLAESTGTTVLSVGVEFKAMSADPEAYAHMQSLTEAVRRQYKGKLTYSANWDEAEGVRWWPLLDYAGVNGYYPLVPDPIRGAETTGRRLSQLANIAGRPVLVLEVGYRSSPMSHQRPWEWPDQVDATVDNQAQARAWAAILTHWLTAPGVRGLMVWVVPTDPDDPASEPAHGFNPLNKPAEEVIARVFGRTHP